MLLFEESIKNFKTVFSSTIMQHDTIETTNSYYTTEGKQQRKVSMKYSTLRYFVMLLWEHFAELHFYILFDFLAVQTWYINGLIWRLLRKHLLNLYRRIYEIKLPILIFQNLFSMLSEVLNIHLIEEQSLKTMHLFVSYHNR